MKKFVFYLLILLTSGCKSILINKSNEGRQGKEDVLQLLLGLNNLRNSERDSITLKDGKILIIYSHFSGTSLKLLGRACWRSIESCFFTLSERSRCLQCRVIFLSDNGDRYPVFDSVAIALNDQ